jgi:cyanophycinase
MDRRHFLAAFKRPSRKNRSVVGPRRKLGWLERLLCLLAVAGAVAVVELGTLLARLSSLPNSTAAPDVPNTGGALLIHGGGQVPDSVRRRFCDLAGGSRARILVIPTRYVPPDDESHDLDVAVWQRYGVESAEILSAPSRSAADEPVFARPIAKATGVWLGGGDQLKLAATYAGTEVERQLKALVERGGVVGGSSAGAAVMSKVMISRGRRSAVEAHGFDLLPGAVIDQHFLKRNRFQRMSGVLNGHPELVGFGIDEHTALVVRLPSGKVSVIGESYVVACVPGREGQPPRTEILKAGDRTSLEALRVWETPVSSPAAEMDELLTAAGE